MHGLPLSGVWRRRHEEQIDTLNYHLTKCFSLDWFIFMVKKCFSHEDLLYLRLRSSAKDCPAFWTAHKFRSSHYLPHQMNLVANWGTVYFGVAWGCKTTLSYSSSRRKFEQIIISELHRASQLIGQLINRWEFCPLCVTYCWLPVITFWSNGANQRSCFWVSLKYTFGVCGLRKIMITSWVMLFVMKYSHVKTIKRLILEIHIIRTHTHTYLLENLDLSFRVNICHTIKYCTPKRFVMCTPRFASLPRTPPWQIPSMEQKWQSSKTNLPRKSIYHKSLK